MWSRLVEMDDKRGYVLLSEFTAYESIDILCPLLDFRLPYQMTVCFLMLVEFLTAESHLAHPLTVAPKYDHDCAVGNGCHAGVLTETLLDYLIDLVADTPGFVNGGYHSSRPDLEVQSGSGAVVVVIGILGLALKQFIALVALMFVADIGID